MLRVMLHSALLPVHEHLVHPSSAGDSFNNNDDSEYDDCLTILASETGSSVETCSTHTGLVPDVETEDGAAHYSQSSPIPTTLVRLPRQPLLAPSSFLVVRVAPGKTLHRHTAAVKASTTEATFPVLHALWEVSAGAPPRNSEVVHHNPYHCLLVPPVEEAWWSADTDAAVATLPSKLVCVYQVRRSDVPAELMLLSPKQTHRSISRVHCEVRLYFCLIQAPSPQDGHCTPSLGLSYKWTSFDVVDCTSSNGTFCRGVRLFPSHRYSFQVNDEESHSGVELQLGDVYSLSIYVGRHPSDFYTKKRITFPCEAGTAARIDAEVQWVTTPAVELQCGMRSSRLEGKTRVKRNGNTSASDASAMSRSRRAPVTPSRVGQKSGAVPFIHHFNNGSEASSTRLTIVTTGIQLTRSQQQKLRRMNVVVNPPMSQFNRATHLVIRVPLMRSVKLLTALPYVQYIVDSTWLDASIAVSLSSQFCTADPEHFRYTERPTLGSIETMNDFVLEELMQTPLQQRQTLFTGQLFWVHPNAKPQDPPDNDLRYVIIASGGVLTETASDATIAVMPRVNLTTSMWHHALHCPQEPQCIYVVPDDIFRGVLQQRRPTVSTVRRPRGCCTLPPNVAEPKLWRKRQPSAPRKPPTTRRRICA